MGVHYHLMGTDLVWGDENVLEVVVMIIQLCEDNECH